MTKEELRKKILTYSDAVVSYTSKNSKKLKYNVVTLDFNNPYIKSKPNKTIETEDTLVTFCWDTDSFRILKPDSIRYITPLSKLLGN